MCFVKCSFVTGEGEDLTKTNEIWGLFWFYPTLSLWCGQSVLTLLVNVAVGVLL